MRWLIIGGCAYLAVGCFVLAYVLEQADWLEDDDITIWNVVVTVLVSPALITWSLLRGERV